MRNFVTTMRHAIRSPRTMWLAFAAAFTVAALQPIPASASTPTSVKADIDNCFLVDIFKPASDTALGNAKNFAEEFWYVFLFVGILVFVLGIIVGRTRVGIALAVAGIVLGLIIPGLANITTGGSGC